MYKEPKHIVSSYTPNNIGKTIYDTVRKLKPKKVIELGPATGHTTITMAQSLKDNIGNTPPIYAGHINSYDIWDDQYWGTQENCQKEINEWGVQECVTLKHLDFYENPCNNYKFVKL